ncbi:MAG: SMC-Scp complex subunit ScpB [Alphaproteobacteria bacterium]|nr:SMC-Scp complex subunit ScpB [Alphaproteobacteria bacterium]
MSNPEQQTIDPARVLEALLFATTQPLSTKELHERMPEGSDVGGALMALQKEYESRGINLIEMEGQWAFRTAADLGTSLQVDREVQKKLSRAGLETLAIVAYHQPVTRAEIENIRGVATHKGTLDALMEMGWVKPGKRREAPGRPVTWMTTAQFLDHFSLESITDLPGLDDLKASGLLDRRPAIEAIPSGDLFDSIAEEEDNSAEPEDEDGEEEYG